MSASDHVKPIYLGQQPYQTPDTSSSGEEVTLGGEIYYKSAPSIGCVLSS